MRRIQQRAKSVVSLDSHRRTAEAPAARAPAPPAHPLYGVALLKVALELKKHPTARVEDVIENVLTRMRLPESDFRSFLAKEGGILKVIADRLSA